MTKRKTQVKGVSVKGKTVRVRPTVSSDSANVSYPQETIADITQPNASHSLPSGSEKASYILPSLEPLNTNILSEFFDRFDSNPFTSKKSFGHYAGLNWKVWGLGFSFDFGSYETGFDIQLGPLYASIYYG